MKKLVSIFMAVAALIPGAIGQATFKIVGGNVTANGQPNIVLNNVDWVNNGGSFIADSSTVILRGTDDTQIGGNTPTTFWAMRLNKSGGQLILTSDMSISDTLTFQQGIMDLSGNDLTLDPANGGLSGESETSRITGLLGGEVVKIVTLNAPSNDNPGNIGLRITSTDNLGTTIVRRGHQPQAFSGGSGIQRYYDVVPANGGTSIDMDYTYLNAEVQGFSETDLEIFRSDDGGTTWAQSGYTTRDIVNNVISQTGVDPNHRFTLGTISIFPVEWLGFDAWPEDRKVHCQWLTASEINSDYFVVERSQDGQTFEAFANLPAAGNSQEVLTYDTWDNTPHMGQSYYRVQQVDLDGTIDYAPVVSVYITPLATLSMFPNPTEDIAWVDATLYDGGPVSLVVSDMSGRKILQQQHSLDAGQHRFQLDMENQPEGVYTVQVRIGQEVNSMRLIVK